jgi:hypothetical protein
VYSRRAEMRSIASGGAFRKTLNGVSTIAQTKYGRKIPC